MIITNYNANYFKRTYASPPVHSPTCNWAFIDIQNLYKSVLLDGWKINLTRLREYLAVEHNVLRAIFFMGYINRYAGLYKKIRKAGFEIEFRDVTILPNGKIDGGNVDADISGFALDYKMDYREAVLIADDGDYSRLLRSLVRQDKLRMIISSHIMKRTSHFMKAEVPRDKIISINSLRPIVEEKSIHFVAEKKMQVQSRG